MILMKMIIVKMMMVITISSWRVTFPSKASGWALVHSYGDNKGSLLLSQSAALFRAPDLEVGEICSMVKIKIRLSAIL